MAEPSKNMEWMYKPAALINREDYLLGRSVDKSFSILESVEQTGTFNYADEVEKDLTPLSIFAPTRSGPVDVIKKIKEDPLYQIQKKEEENLKQLLKNPVRMKQMREINERQERQRRLSASSDSKTKAKHKSKKSRRDSSSDSSSSSDGDPSRINISKAKSFQDIDKLISEKLKSLKQREEKSESSSDEDAKKKHASKKHHHHHQNRGTDHQHRDGPYDRRDRGYRESQRHRDRDHHRSERQRSRSRSRSRERDRERSSSDRRPSNNKPSSKISSSAPKPKAASSSDFRKPLPTQKRAVLDEAELEKRRQEMMSNAKWRDEQRTKNVTKYREEEKKEAERHSSHHDPDFIRKQLIEAANTGSVEKRIKSNSYNIQKSHSAMSQNFARR